MSESKKLDLETTTTATNQQSFDADVEVEVELAQTKGKTLSVSSTDSFLSTSDLASEMMSGVTNSNNNNTSASGIAEEDGGKMMLNDLPTSSSSASASAFHPSNVLARCADFGVVGVGVGVDGNDDNFDFTVTGAKPKRKTTTNLNSKSLSSSTSSSLSSLSVASHHSSALTTSSSTSAGGSGGSTAGVTVGAVSNAAPSGSSSSSTCSSGYKSSSSSSSSSSGSSSSHFKNKPASFDSVSTRKGLIGLGNQHTTTEGLLSATKTKKTSYIDLGLPDPTSKTEDLSLNSHHFFKLDNNKNSDLLINTSQELNLDIHKSIFPDQSNLLLHHPSLSSQAAETCHKTTASAASALADDPLEMLVEIVTCPLCLKVVESDLESHFNSEHKEYECHFCNLLFDSDYSLNQHVNTVHSGEDFSTFPAKSRQDLIGHAFSAGGVVQPSSSSNLEDDLVTRSKMSIANSNKQLARSLTDVWDLDEAANDDDDDVVVLDGPDSESGQPKQQEEFTCPICEIKMKDQVWLEMHVDSHFNPPVAEPEGAAAAAGAFVGHNPFDLVKLAGSKSRSQSASSLAGNVDENFEMDQIMTLTECGLGELNSNAHPDYADFPADSSMLSCTDLDCDPATKSDYELALLLDKEERSRFKVPLAPTTANSLESQDFLAAQLIERQQNEMLKYKLFKENNQEMDGSIDESIALAMSMEDQSDVDYASELEHEWLKQRFGMGDVRATTKAIENLEQALKNKKITPLVYHSEKESIEKRLESVVDDSQTQSAGLIELIRSVPLNKNTRVRYVCTQCDHYSSGFIDRGYGCGYRNVQMLLSSMRHDPELAGKLFNNGRNAMPSIRKIQQLIEKSWELGFDLEGKKQFGGVLAGTARWIGASDVCSMFSSLRIKTELVDITLPAKSSVGDKEATVARILFRFVRQYFENQTKTGKPIHPIYLQHDGHSRTIVGIEVGAKFDTLLLFDPGTRKAQTDNFRSNPFKSMNIFRRSLNAFKKDQYQLLLIKGAIESIEEYERAKRLQSTKINQ